MRGVNDVRPNYQNQDEREAFSDGWDMGWPRYILEP